MGQPAESPAMLALVTVLQFASGNTYLLQSEGLSARVDALVPVGANRYFQGIRLTKTGKLLTNVSVTWTAAPDRQMVMVVSDEPAGMARLQ